MYLLYSGQVQELAAADQFQFPRGLPYSAGSISRMDTRLPVWLSAHYPEIFTGFRYLQAAILPGFRRPFPLFLRRTSERLLLIPSLSGRCWL